MKDINSDFAYNYIRERIVQGDFRAGQKLPTNSLSARIGVSRTPIRDALRQLEADGLVTIRARLAARVRTMSDLEFRELLEVRLALETHAAALAAIHRSPADLTEIGAYMEAMRDLTRRLSAGADEVEVLAEFARADVSFHAAIIRAAKNDLIRKQILSLHLLSRVVLPANAPSPTPIGIVRYRLIQRGHEEILRALKKGNAAGARAAMHRHIQAAIDEHERRLRTRRESAKSRRHSRQPRHAVNKRTNSSRR